MLREQLRFTELPGKRLRITYRPSIKLLLGVIVLLGLPVWLIWYDGGLKSILASAIAIMFGGGLGFIWVDEWITIELSKTRGASIRRGVFNTWAIPASAIAWVWAYPHNMKDRKFYCVALRLRVELPDDKRRGVSYFWARLLWYNLGEWVEQLPPIIQELNAALAACGFGQPADLDQVSQMASDYNWLAQTARKHHDPHVRTISLATLLKQFPRKARSPLETALDSDSPLVALLASCWLIEGLATEYLKDYQDAQKGIAKATQTLQRLSQTSSTPAFIREQARWTLQRGARIQRKLRSQMMWFGGIGLLIMAVAAFALFKAHTFILFPHSAHSVLYRILGFLCGFFGAQSFFVGFLYAIVLKENRYERYNYEREMNGIAAGFSYVFAFLSLAVFYKASYLAALICYLALYPIFCYFTYKRF